MKKNPLTSKYYEKKIVLKESRQLIVLYEKHRRKKIKGFLEKFQSGSLGQIFQTAVDLLKKKRVKLFFSQKDIRMAMSKILQILTD